MNNSIKSLPERQRPYERFYYDGGQSLSDQELLAIILGSGSSKMNALETASKMLMTLGTNEGISELRRASIEQLMEIPGVGISKAIRIKASFELANRSKYRKLEAGVDCSNPENISEYYFNEISESEREELRVLLLNAKNILLREVLISTGGLSSTVIYPRDIFKEAVRANASSIILIHNHPSGNPQPSMSDIETTIKIFEAGEILGIRLHDHIIFGKDIYFSLHASDEYRYIFKTM